MMRFLIAVLTPFVWWFCRMLFKVEFHGVDNIPREGACIITPNHVTYADPIWITIPMPRRIYYMAWDKPFRIPVLGLMMRMFGAFPVNLDVAADALPQGKRLNWCGNGRGRGSFREAGGRGRGRWRPSKLGPFQLGSATGVPSGRV